MKANGKKGNQKLPRYNHYVPRFILDNFANSGMLSILDKRTLKQFKLAPYRAMGEKDFNNVRIGAHILSFEEKFSYLEELAAPVISRVLKQTSLTEVDPGPGTMDRRS